VDDRNLTAGSQSAVGFAQQPKWILDMQDIEQHCAPGLRIWQSRPIGYEVANDSHDVR
jgi:hypothetical protein